MKIGECLEFLDLVKDMAPSTPSTPTTLQNSQKTIVTQQSPPKQTPPVSPPPGAGNSVNSQFGLRISNVDNEGKSLSPILGLDGIPVPSFADSLKSLNSLIPQISSFAFLSEMWLDNDAKNLPAIIPRDQMLALHLYTREWNNAEESLYHVLNQRLRDADRNALKCFFPIFKALAFWLGISSEVF